VAAEVVAEAEGDERAKLLVIERISWAGSCFRTHIPEVGSIWEVMYCGVARNSENQVEDG
jgi:hypothetical protein